MGWRELARDLRFTAGLLRGRPFSVLLQVTNRCNMSCSFCGFWSHPAAPDEELTLDDFGRIESELSRIGTFLVSLEGGEPFLRPDLPEIVRIFAKRHIPLVYTNGWFVNAGNARALFEAGLVQAGVSIDYPEPARHDARRGVEGAFSAAWRAVDLLRAAAPFGGKQVHVMTVLLEENREGLEPLFEMSAGAGAGHCVTLLSRKGFQRGKQAEAPAPVSPPVSEWLAGLWRRNPHLRFFESYLDRIDPFLTGGAMPACPAGVRSFNIDHRGNVSPCIERIDAAVGNVRAEPLANLLGRLAKLDWLASCQDCWTLCRACCQFMGPDAGFREWRDLAGRMRSC